MARRATPTTTVSLATLPRPATLSTIGTSVATVVEEDAKEPEEVRDGATTTRIGRPGT
jgi:hypothetical protein